MSLSDPKFDHGVSLDAIKDLIEGDYMEMLRQKTLDDGVLKLSEYGGHRKLGLTVKAPSLMPKKVIEEGEEQMKGE